MIVALGPVPVKVKFNSIQVAVVSWSGENIKHFIPVSSKSIEKEAKFKWPENRQSPTRPCQHPQSALLVLPWLGCCLELFRNIAWKYFVLWRNKLLFWWFFAWHRYIGFPWVLGKLVDKNTWPDLSIFKFLEWNYRLPCMQSIRMAFWLRCIYTAIPHKHKITEIIAAFTTPQNLWPVAPLTVAEFWQKLKNHWPVFILHFSLCQYFT